MKEREERDGVLGKSVVDFNCREKLDYMPMMGEQSQRGEWGPT